MPTVPTSADLPVAKLDPANNPPQINENVLDRIGRSGAVLGKGVEALGEAFDVAIARVNTANDAQLESDGKLAYLNDQYAARRDIANNTGEDGEYLKKTPEIFGGIYKNYDENYASKITDPEKRARAQAWGQSQTQGAVFGYRDDFQKSQLNMQLRKVDGAVASIVDKITSEEGVTPDYYDQSRDALLQKLQESKGISMTQADIDAKARDIRSRLFYAATQFLNRKDPNANKTLWEMRSRLEQDFDNAPEGPLEGRRQFTPQTGDLRLGGRDIPTNNMNAAQRELNLSPQERALYQQHLGNLYSKGGVDNEDGTRSTLKATTAEVDGKTYVVPTVRDGRILAPDEAVDRAIGEGINKYPAYGSEEEAQQRYQAMHGYLEKDTQSYQQQKATAGQQGQQKRSAAPAQIDITDYTGRGAPARSRSSDAIEGVVIHHTSGSTLEGALDWSKKKGTGANYYVDRDGKVYQWAGDNQRMAHIQNPSDISRTNVARNLSSDNSIGIEVVARNDKDVTPEQRAAVQALATQLAQKYNIKPQNIVGHGEIQNGPGRNSREDNEGLFTAKAVRASLSGGDAGSDQGQQARTASRGGPLARPRDAAGNAVPMDQVAQGFLPVGGSMQDKSWADVPKDGGSPNSREWGGPRQGGHHAGIDIPGKVGDPIIARDGGTVLFAGTGAGYGNMVDVKFPDGTVQRFAHLSKIDVQQGDTLAPGAQVGALGYTGNAGPEFPHLHLEVFKNEGDYQDAAGQSSRAGWSKRINPREYYAQTAPAQSRNVRVAQVAGDTRTDATGANIVGQEAAPGELPWRTQKPDTRPGADAGGGQEANTGNQGTIRLTDKVVAADPLKVLEGIPSKAKLSEIAPQGTAIGDDPRVAAAKELAKKYFAPERLDQFDQNEVTVGDIRQAYERARNDSSARREIDDQLEPAVRQVMEAARQNPHGRVRDVLGGETVDRLLDKYPQFRDAGDTGMTNQEAATMLRGILGEDLLPGKPQRFERAERKDIHFGTVKPGQSISINTVNGKFTFTSDDINSLTPDIQKMIQKDADERVKIVQENNILLAKSMMASAEASAKQTGQVPPTYDLAGIQRALQNDKAGQRLLYEHAVRLQMARSIYQTFQGASNIPSPVLERRLADLLPSEGDENFDIKAKLAQEAEERFQKIDDMRNPTKREFNPASSVDPNPKGMEVKKAGLAPSDLVSSIRKALPNNEPQNALQMHQIIDARLKSQSMIGIDENDQRPLRNDEAQKLSGLIHQAAETQNYEPALRKTYEAIVKTYGDEYAGLILNQVMREAVHSDSRRLNAIGVMQGLEEKGDIKPYTLELMHQRADEEAARSRLGPSLPDSKPPGWFQSFGEGYMRNVSPLWARRGFDQIQEGLKPTAKPSPDDIAKLRANPEQISDFERRYGKDVRKYLTPSGAK